MAARVAVIEDAGDLWSELAPAGRQLRARGRARWAVGERKEILRRNQRWREVGENCSRNFDLDQGELHRGRGEPDRSPASAAIADAGALLRLAVGPLVVMRMTSHRVCGSDSAVRSTVYGGTCRNIDRQAPVHDARVKLRRLGQTDGEPDGDDAGETAEDSSASHASNIGSGAVRDRLCVLMTG